MNTYIVLPSSSCDHYRVESFIEHQDACNVGRALPELHAAQHACLSQTTSSRSPSSDTNVSGGSAAWHCIQMPKPAATFLPLSSDHRRSLELQLLPSSNSPLSTLPSYTISPTSAEAHATELQLSIGPVGAKDAGKDDLRVAMAEKAMAEEARAEAKRQIELADEEFANAKRIRQQAQAELNKAYLIRDHAAKRINAMLLQITCPACHHQFRVKPSSLAGEINTDDEDGHHGPRFLSSS